MTSAGGRATGTVTSSPASGARGRSPRSFQARTSATGAPSYAKAEVAERKARRRPAHSRQRTTGQAVGAPQRSHRGGRSGRSDARHAEQSPDAGPWHATQRRGSKRSMNHADQPTDNAVT